MLDDDDSEDDQLNELDTLDKKHVAEEAILYYSQLYHNIEKLDDLYNYKHMDI